MLLVNNLPFIGNHRLLKSLVGSVKIIEVTGFLLMFSFPGDEFYWKLVADFIGPQSGEGLELQKGTCKNRVLIQVGLLREENNFPWTAILDWLKKMFSRHQSANFRCLIERGIAATCSLENAARQSFLDSNVNFNFVGPICDSIGVERKHLLELKDFSERAQSIEVTNGLILELSAFVDREKLAPVVIVTWLRNFNPEFCKNGNVQRAYQALRGKIKRLKFYSRNFATRSHRRSAAMEGLLQSPFELVKTKTPKLAKRRIKREDASNQEKASVGGDQDSSDGMASGGSEDSEGGGDLDDELECSSREDSGGAEGLTLLDIAMLSVQKLWRIYGQESATCQQVSLDLLRNQYALTCREHPDMAEFEQKLESLAGGVPLASPVHFLNTNASFLVDVHDAVEQQILNFEREIILSKDEKLGRDKLPQFLNFVNLSESATSRYVHMACDILNPRTPGPHNYGKHWVAFCEEKRNPSRVAVAPSQRFAGYLEAAAGLVHHYKEVPLFFSDLLTLSTDANVLVQSVAADATDSVIQSFVCVLAILYCKILGPYWQLLKSGAKYSLYSHYLLGLYQRFLDWSKDPSSLLEPEEASNVFLQYPLQEKRFQGVFEYCGQWHTNRELIRACLKRTVKRIAGVAGSHLKDFLPGGKLCEVPPPDVSSQLASCTFSVLMAQYPFGHAFPYEKTRCDTSRQHRNLSSDESVEHDCCHDSAEEFGKNSSAAQRDEYDFQSKKKIKKEKSGKDCREEGENMDRSYITAVVSRHGGPCKTQQELDQMLLRLEGLTRAQRKEALRCEVVYHKTILNNMDPNLNCVFLNSTQMASKLKLALPRVRPSYSLVLEPRKTKTKRMSAAEAELRGQNASVRAACS